MIGNAKGTISMAAAAAEHPDKPGLGTRIAYGFGAGAYGVKDGGFSYFLLLFYSQVIGVDARLVGLAITIALVIDAVADPIIGYWSDNLRSRWGRRHPFLYASALPTAATYFLIWDPPAGWSQTALFWYLLGLATLIRISISFYEIPSTALGPELARSYDERSALFGAIATGISASLSFYFSAYFWGFSSEQIGLITMSVFLSAAIGGAMSPVVSRTMGKQRGAVVIGLLAGIVLPLPIILRLFGLLPPNGDPAIFWIVFFVTMIDVGLIICFQVLTASMLADLVEQAEVRTGRRNEGIFFAANTFIRKAVQGLGVMAASFVLTLAQFPKGANPSQVPESSLWQLGATYVPAIWLVWALMIFAVSRYRLSRAGHEANLATLAERG